MKIIVAKSAGFCFGVRRALEIALKTIRRKKSVYMLGDIVHNEEVVRLIKKAGIKKIKRLTPGKNKTFLIQAHGISQDAISRILKLKYNIVDATCPMVKEIHRIAKDMESKGYNIVIIGDKHHDEVRGIIGQLKHKAIVIDRVDNLPIPAIKKVQRIAVVVQSTQNLENVLKILENLKSYAKEIKFFNTICRPTRQKQQEIRKLPLNVDLMLIIGSKQSANTKRLYEIAKGLNRQTYWIQSKKDLKPRWFRRVKSVGVSSGASTPDVTTKEVARRIAQISKPKKN